MKEEVRMLGTGCGLYIGRDIAGRPLHPGRTRREEFTENSTNPRARTGADLRTGIWIDG